MKNRSLIMKNDDENAMSKVKPDVMMKPSKVRLIINEFEENIKVKEAKTVKGDGNSARTDCKNAFKVLMESSKKLGGGITTSPGGKNIRKRKLSLKTRDGKKR